MIINIRYHIASIVAVFLALGVGILLGSMIIGSGTLVNQQQLLADRLEKHLDDLRNENGTIREQLTVLQMETQTQRQFTRELLPFLVAGRLEGQKVAVIETSPFPPSVDLKPVLEMAGASVTSVTTITNGLELGEYEEEVVRLNNWGDEEGLREKTAQALADAILSGRTPLVDYLEQQGLLNTVGDYGLPVNQVVVVGGSFDKERSLVTELDMEMITYFTKKGIHVCGTEESLATNSYIKEYQRRCQATVDNIDTVPGQFSLVMALSGEPGNYGVKETAERLIPAFGG